MLNFLIVLFYNCVVHNHVAAALLFSFAVCACRQSCDSCSSSPKWPIMCPVKR